MDQRAFIKQIKNTAIAINTHAMRTKVQDFVLILNTAGFDANFYEIIMQLKDFPALLGIYKVITDEAAKLDEETADAKEVSDKLKAAYKKALASNDFKRIKKLRHAYFKFAEYNKISLSDLLGDDSENQYPQKLKAHRQ